MSPCIKHAVLAIVSMLLVGVLPPIYRAPAQTPPSRSVAGSSVLPTGGGQALLDPSDTLFLLLDHQAGLFRR
jgi:hypothetical protein